MIARIWHGWTSKEKADRYEALLKQEIFIGIEQKNVKGYKGIQLLKRDLESEVEFTTIMWFDNLESVKQFSGDEHYELAYVPPEAREVLARFENESIHWELRHTLHYE